MKDNKIALNKGTVKLSSISTEKSSIREIVREIIILFITDSSWKKKVIISEIVKNVINPSRVLFLKILLFPNSLPTMPAILSDMDKNNKESMAIFLGKKSATKKTEKHTQVAPVKNFCSSFFIIPPKNLMKNFLKDFISNLR